MPYAQTLARHFRASERLFFNRLYQLWVSVFGARKFFLTFLLCPFLHSSEIPPPICPKGRQNEEKGTTRGPG